MNACVCSHFRPRRAGTLDSLVVSARISKWSAAAPLPMAVVRGSLGEAGEIETETACLIEGAGRDTSPTQLHPQTRSHRPSRTLRPPATVPCAPRSTPAEFGVVDAPFSDAALACLPVIPEGTSWDVPPEERARRRDFSRDRRAGAAEALRRGAPPTPFLSFPRTTASRPPAHPPLHPCAPNRVFSIDPPTARDLDDALSIQRLPSGNLRVGVHIADVTHFLPAGSALDVEARQRATSTYFVQRVVPMLPRLLCEELCSLNPGVPRLSFSVEWELTPDGEVLSEWFGKSVIESCCKLDYGTAQQMIDASEAGAPWPEQPADKRLTGGHAWADVCGDVLLLHQTAQRIRAARFEGGALRLDNTKLQFALDEDGNPTGCRPYATGASNQLVEEFMLLANRSVAKFVARGFPDRALLRRHPPPDARKLEQLVEFSKRHGLGVDASSAAALQRTLAALRAARPEVAAVAVQMATKPMQLALYFNTGDLPEADWVHYALAMPFYTHFTSPIRCAVRGGWAGVGLFGAL